WESEGYHVLHDFLALPFGPDRTKKAKDIVDRGIKSKDEAIGGQAAGAAAFLALPDATSGMKPDEAAKLKIAVLVAYVDRFPEMSARIDLAQAYVDAGDKDNAPKSLKTAADSNLVHTDPEGEQNWKGIDKAVKDAQTKKLMSDADVKAIADLKAKWK